MQSTLQKIVDFDYNSLDAVWKVTNLSKFSDTKNLFEYQEEAIKHALKLLSIYYNEFNKESYSTSINPNWKKRLLELYNQNGFTGKYDISSTAKSWSVISDPNYFEVEDDKIQFWNYINRMSFWMATGSGKSVVLVKLIEVLLDLIRNDLIPQKNILILTHREDLIDQIKKHINELNQHLSIEKNITLLPRSLREFPDVIRDSQMDLYKSNYINIFYYRSDLINDVQKENIIDFRKDYDNNGEWYVFLDEAHKGDKEDSKRQHYYSALARNGFLFNFSATFTEEIDQETTVYNFNLAEFIKKGYGKHLYILTQEFGSFRDAKNQEIETDYTVQEKQKIVLMSLILLTYIKKVYQALSKKSKDKIYHNPLLLTLVNTVDVEESDLLMFFKEIEKIAGKQINSENYMDAVNELVKELSQNPELLFEKSEIDIDLDELNKITIDEILKYVFNADSSGSIEPRINTGNKQEIIFKLSSSDKPFALIKIGDTTNWVNDVLQEYHIEEQFDNESSFELLSDSDINILMGSRAFYEGWDSNRPNIINFINIGTQSEARKFILQSVGRGIRIEPKKDLRKRLKYLLDERKIDAFYNSLVNSVQPIESLFVFGTKRIAIKTVLDFINKEQPEEEFNLELFEERKERKDLELLIPIYKEKKNSELKIVSKFPLNPIDAELLKDIILGMNESALILNFNLDYNSFILLTESFNNFEKNFIIDKSEKRIGHPELLIRYILNYFRIVPEEFDKFKKLQDEIVHFKHIRVAIPIEEVEKFRNKIKQVKEFTDPDRLRDELFNLVQEKKISRDEYKKRELKIAELKREDVYTYKADNIKIKNIVEHYYFPLLLSETDKTVWIKHIIKDKSEVDFVEALEEYLKTYENFFKKFDWWMFSKIDQTLDKKLYIPYIDKHNAEKRNFYPDFIFWLKKDNKYYILFIDPKGIGRREYLNKVEGYRELFEENGKPKIFNHNGFDIQVLLKLKTRDINEFTEFEKPIKKYWFDEVKELKNIFIMLNRT